MDAVQELIEMARRLGVPSALADRLDKEVRSRFGGDRVYIPSRSRTDEESIRAMAHQLRGDGQRYRKIADLHGLSERRVRQIVDG